MLISRNILQSFFSKTLPKSSVIAHELTMKSFEVESVEKRENDEVLEVDVLPNRGSDCLSHLGVAREVSLIFNLPIDSFNDSTEPLAEVNSEKLDIRIEPGTASRFIGILLSGLDNSKVSPQSLRDALIALGERPISPIVDVTNYVMILTGQPLHAYDADKLKEISSEPLSLHVGFSKKADTLETLDGQKHELHHSTLLIKSAREGEPLGLAGIKGGMATAVDETTSRIVLEAASFTSIAVRKSAQSVRLHTGASKRFENGIVPELPIVGIRTALNFLKNLCPELVVEALKDEYPEKTKPTIIHLKRSHVFDLLGIEVADSSQVETLTRLGALVVEENDSFRVTPPWYRPDLSSAVDLVEELGRLNGYEQIEAKPLSEKETSLNQTVLLNEILREFLTKLGYDEIITRSFQKAGDIELENPLAKNTPFLRSNLIENMKSSLSLNAQNAELLELEYIKLFEVGTVFTKDAEEIHLAIGIKKTKNARSKLVLAREIEEIEQGILRQGGGSIDLLKCKSETDEETDSIVVEYNLNTLSAIEITDFALTKKKKQTFGRFSEFSVFPYVLRDVAIWTPSGTTAESVEEIIRKNLGSELRVVTLFDKFEKDFEGKRRTSFAFRLVFQSFEKTLSDEEINLQMKALDKAILECEGFQMR